MNEQKRNKDENEIENNSKIYEEKCEENNESQTEVAQTEVATDTEDSSKNKDLKIKELEDKYLRVYADFENTKKRLERDKYQALEYANEGILKDLLPVLDTLESALKGIENAKKEDSTIESIFAGIKLTIDNFIKVLNKNGVEIIDTSAGFDPNLHNAIMQVEDENKEDGEISQVIQKGYKYKERVIRPSMVSITKNK